MLATAQNVV